MLRLRSGPGAVPRSRPAAEESKAEMWQRSRLKGGVASVRCAGLCSWSFLPGASTARPCKVRASKRSGDFRFETLSLLACDAHHCCDDNPTPVCGGRDERSEQEHLASGTPPAAGREQCTRCANDEQREEGEEHGERKTHRVACPNSIGCQGHCARYDEGAECRDAVARREGFFFGVSLGRQRAFVRADAQ